METNGMILNNPTFDIDIDGKDVADSFVKDILKAEETAKIRHKEMMDMLKQIRDKKK